MTSTNYLLEGHVESIAFALYHRKILNHILLYNIIFFIIFTVPNMF